MYEMDTMSFNLFTIVIVALFIPSALGALWHLHLSVDLGILV